MKKIVIEYRTYNNRFEYNEIFSDHFVYLKNILVKIDKRRLKKPLEY